MFRWSALLHNTLYGRCDLTGGKNAALSPFYLPMLKDNEGGHALDLVARRYGRVPVDVHLQDGDGIS